PTRCRQRRSGWKVNCSSNHPARMTQSAGLALSRTSRNASGKARATARSRSYPSLCAALRPIRFLAELGRAFLHERSHAFLRLLRLVVEIQGLEAEAADSADGIGRCVKGALRNGDGRGALFQNLGAPLVDLLIELIMRHDGVAQAHLQRLLGVVAPAQVPYLSRALLPDHRSKIRGSPAGV